MYISITQDLAADPPTSLNNNQTQRHAVVTNRKKYTPQNPQLYIILILVHNLCYRYYFYELIFIMIFVCLCENFENLYGISINMFNKLNHYLDVCLLDSWSYLTTSNNETK